MWGEEEDLYLSPLPSTSPSPSQLPLLTQPPAPSPIPQPNSPVLQYPVPHSPQRPLSPTCTTPDHSSPASAPAILSIADTSCVGSSLPMPMTLAQSLPTSPRPPTPPPWPAAHIFSAGPDRIICYKCCKRNYNVRWFSHCFMFHMDEKRTYRTCLQL